VFGDSRLTKVLAALGAVGIAAAFGYYLSGQPMDFRVYYYGAQGVFDGTRPVYGATSGLGWPMHYRYPPLFLLVFAPLTLVPLGLAAAIWVWAKLGVLLLLLQTMRERMPIHVISFLLITPYLIEEFRYGNAQFFVLALTIGALRTLPGRPVLAAAALALAISIKVWPLFFIPYLAVRREWKAVAWALSFVAVLALVPATYFGVSENFSLLQQWLAQESQTQLSENEIWFPNQSLRGVLMRYLTVVDYSRVPDSNYAQVNVASLQPTTVRWLWMFLAGGIYAGFLLLANQRRENDARLDHGLAFCLLALLEPFTQKYALTVLLWPSIVAGGLMGKPLQRLFIYGAVILVLIQPLVPGASAQRLLQVLGMDFAATLMLAGSLVVACLVQPRIAPITRDTA